MRFPIRAFQSSYVGRHDFPTRLGDFELRQWFTFDVRDRRSIRKAFRSRYWIGAALHLGFLAMTGTTLGSLEYVPAVLLRHLGRQFVQRVPDLATLRSLYRRSQTLYEHQRWAIEHWGLVEFDERVEKRLAEHLAQRTHATLSRVRLEQMAHEWLYRSNVQMQRRAMRRRRWVVEVEGRPRSQRFQSPSLFSPCLNLREILSMLRRIQNVAYG